MYQHNEVLIAFVMNKLEEKKTNINWFIITNAYNKGYMSNWIHNFQAAQGDTHNVDLFLVLYN